MPSNYYKAAALPDVKRVRQITTSHCAPAVAEMLLSKLGISVSQSQIVAANTSGRKIETWGMTIAEMAMAVNNLFPDLTFWYKFNAEIYDLRYITELYHYPVGVEWQGDFDWEDEDEETGHYGVISQVDMDREFLLLIDPYYPVRDRKFSIENFNERWWDINEIADSVTGEIRRVYDDHPMFVITPNSADFPANIGMSRDIDLINR